MAKHKIKVRNPNFNQIMFFTSEEIYLDQLKHKDALSEALEGDPRFDCYHLAYLQTPKQSVQPALEGIPLFTEEDHRALEARCNSNPYELETSLQIEEGRRLIANPGDLIAIKELKAEGILPPIPAEK